MVGRFRSYGRYARLWLVVHVGMRLRLAKTDLGNLVLRLRLRRVRFQLWLKVGGSVNRHPHHWLVWTGTMAVLTATGIAAALAEWTPLRIVGFALVACAFYVALGFFWPLPLPPIRDEELIQQRRASPQFAAIEREIAEIEQRIARHRRRSQAIRRAIRSGDYSEIDEEFEP